MTTVSELMTRELVSVEPAATVAEAATLMGEHGVGSVLVLEDERLAGILTERDVVRALAADFDTPHHPVAQWMTPDPVSISKDAAARQALEVMLEHGFRHLPVLDGDRVAGVVSLRDLTRPDAVFGDDG